MYNVLCVDDEINILNALQRLLNQQKKFNVDLLLDGNKLLAVLDKKNYDFVILDYKMPGVDSVNLLSQITINFPDVNVIFLSGFGTIELAVDTLKLGASDFIQKPSLNELPNRLEKLIENRNLKKENFLLKKQLKKKYDLKNIIGKTPEMQDIFKTVSKLTDSDSSVLIQGESGTGKELIAKALHYSGIKKELPFITIDCSSISHSVIESELFGHKKGSFTGALTSKIGLLKSAGNGTIFLDEISELPFNLQSKLLRAIQEKEIRPVGSNETEKFHARIIAATNKILNDEIKGGTFRKDLYYRLNVVCITLPPLRNRKDDIPLLVNYFIKKFNHQKKLNRSINGISNSALRKLIDYDWPGNIRELENYIERAFILGCDKIIDSKDLPSKIIDSNCNDLATTADFEKDLILKTLNEFNFDKAKVAEYLKMSLATLYRKIKKYQIQPKFFG